MYIYLLKQGIFLNNRKVKNEEEDFDRILLEKQGYSFIG
jgi:hypothetical protein